MEQYTDIEDIVTPSELIDEAVLLKKNPYAFDTLGKHKTLVMLFFKIMTLTEDI